MKGRYKKSHEVASSLHEEINLNESVKNIPFNFNKELIINKTLDKYLPESVIVSQEEKLNENIINLSLSSQNLIKDLFESLDEENREVVLILSKDED